MQNILDSADTDDWAVMGVGWGAGVGGRGDFNSSFLPNGVLAVCVKGGWEGGVIVTFSFSLGFLPTNAHTWSFPSAQQLGLSANQAPA